MRTIGLMSGTSIDGIDAALVRFDGDAGSMRWELEAFRTSPYNAARRAAIRRAIEAGDAAVLCDINVELGEWLAAAALSLCEESGMTPADVAAIGSHGHTIRHRPASPGRRGATLQLGCAATIAERTGVTVISDFRSRDVAAGGQGAPLVPFADRLLFSSPDRIRVLVNIGGVANLTRVPVRGSSDALLAFDTGPGNALIDGAVECATDGGETFDRDGRRAAAGHVIGTVLADLLADPFLAMAPPRSTGRERFGHELVARIVASCGPTGEREWADLIATLTELTSRTIADSVRRYVAPLGADEVIVTGGGAHNPVIMSRLRQLLDPLPVFTGGEAGMNADAKEAVAFAALAWAHLSGVPGNVCEVTGAGGPRILGSMTPGRTP